jgi:hypothetical protein
MSRILLCSSVGEEAAQRPFCTHWEQWRHHTCCYGLLMYFLWLSETVSLSKILLFLDEKIPRIKESVSHAKGDGCRGKI